MKILITDLNNIKGNNKLIKRYISLLPLVEKEYFNSLVNQKRSLQFLVGRALLRITLGDILRIDPPYIKILKQVGGKPELDKNIQNIHFNISHSKDIIALAINSHEVGIDVEFMKPRVFLDIADHFFKIDEANKIRNLPTSDQKKLFYKYWTQKEATIKCAGNSLSSISPELNLCNEYSTRSFDLIAEYMISIAFKSDYQTSPTSEISIISTTP